MQASRCLQVKRTKEMLSANTEAPFSVEELMDGIDFRASITRHALLSRLLQVICKPWGTYSLAVCLSHMQGPALWQMCSYEQRSLVL